jgi:ornithine carbamoyltransferase
MRKDGMATPARSLISLDDLTDDELHAIVHRGVEIASGSSSRALDGAVVGVYFAKTSTRTRAAFSCGALRLGAGIVTFGPQDLQTNTGETVEDTGRVLSGMLDILVARTAGDPADMRAWAAQDRMAVINAMSAEEHPTQALADLTTLAQHFGRVEGLRVLYVGEGNNTAAALALALTRCKGAVLELRTPPGYGLPAGVRAKAEAQALTSGALLVERHHMAALPGDMNVVYTSRWQTTGTVKPSADWRDVFTEFQVTRDIWRHTPDAVFMHDLPAHRGEEVTAEVLDGPASIAFRQAQNKMHSAMAVLEWSRTSADGEDERP